jgi:hypothetical protein
MDRNQMLVLALANVPTILTVLIGILLNNGRLTDLNWRMAAFEMHLAHMDSKLASLEHKFDTRFDLLLSKASISTTASPASRRKGAEQVSGLNHWMRPGDACHGRGREPSAVCRPRIISLYSIAADTALL